MNKVLPLFQIVIIFLSSVTLYPGPLCHTAKVMSFIQKAHSFKTSRCLAQLQPQDILKAQRQYNQIICSECGLALEYEGKLFDIEVSDVLKKNTDTCDFLHIMRMQRLRDYFLSPSSSTDQCLK